MPEGMTNKMFRHLRNLSIIIGLAFPQSASAFDDAEWDFIMETLAEVQELSFDNNREYCGYFGYVNGEFAASRIKKGRKSSCRTYEPAQDFDAVASFHTHGRYNWRFQSEIPSTDDLITDNDEGVDGLMATPGGRLWFIDGYKMTAKLLCDLECLPQDDRFERDPELDLKEFYFFNELKDIEGF